MFTLQDMFEPFLKNFFVRNTDATQIKLLKLEILTNLANESNITFILREFQTYISSQDRDLVAATIQAIGRYKSCMSFSFQLVSGFLPSIAGVPLGLKKSPIHA